MPDWYRNTEWSDTVAEAFEARLARSRGQKAQYLSLQGQALIATAPTVAAELLERAVAMGDAFETPRALGHLAQARLAGGNVEGALTAYEEALEAQAAQPNIVGAAPADYAFVVGYFRRAERLSATLPIAEALPIDGVFGPDPQVLATKAMVFELAGWAEQAKTAAVAALPLLEETGEGDAMGISLADLRKRLAAIAGA
jgi:hypothetical protein